MDPSGAQPALSSRRSVDLIIHARWIVPVVPPETVLEHHAIVVHDGIIVDLLPSSDASQKYKTEPEGGELSGLHRLQHHHVLIPGFVNAHTHNAMTLLRSYADDVSVMDWLQKIWKVEREWVSEEFVRDGCRLAIAEMVRCGATTFSDMYFFPQQTAAVAASMGMRCLVGVPVVSFENSWIAGSDPAAIAEKCYEITRKMHTQYRDHPLVNVAIAPHAPYTVTDEQFKDIRALSQELGIPIHIHVHESAKEVSDSEEQHGCRPIARLQRLGCWGEKVIAVHMTQLNEEEIASVVENNVSVVHCPESNMKLCSGTCPVRGLLAAGANVALGTDGAASNDDLDMFGEMRTAALVDKAFAKDPAAITAHQVLEMATMGGARALGLGHDVGSIEIGKRADLTAVKLRTEPVYNPITNLVYVGTNTVTDVWIDGKHVLVDETLKDTSESELLWLGKEWGEKISTTE